ncbi:hypothetical protein [Celeribacter persicus]|uniref:Uncharacterized protein n=1 Tax=Celeribacter persicus TaxID=1651082 RepID=A0A2T5HSC7_9RHOB|nr:hypothetical protein [Celeribacter persicus]PTQ74466.1 hypothetical protein C8N42_104110 [Celeribacter persicus]
MQSFVRRRWFRFLLVGFGPYAVLLYLANIISVHLPQDSGWQIALISLPVLGLLCALWAIMKHVSDYDEFQRKQTSDAIIFAFAATALTTLTWGFLEDAGLPDLPTFAIWPMMGTFWIMGGVIVWLRDR